MRRVRLIIMPLVRITTLHKTPLINENILHKIIYLSTHEDNEQIIRSRSSSFFSHANSKMINMSKKTLHLKHIIILIRGEEEFKGEKN